MSKVMVQSLFDYVHAQLVSMPYHGFVTDEPLEAQGAELGPNPYQLLTAALAGCTAMTVQAYARRRGYPLHEVAIEVEHSRDHAEDCKQCEDPEQGKIELLRRRIIVRGPLTDEQRDDLLRVAQRCPVHKTLRASPEVLDEIEVVI